jgi:hypothetical protein
MNFYHDKKDEEKDLVTSTSQEQLVSTVESNQTAEFDEIGTALNEI